MNSCVVGLVGVESRISDCFSREIGEPRAELYPLRSTMISRASNWLVSRMMFGQTMGLVFDHGFADVDVDAFVLGRGVLSVVLSIMLYLVQTFGNCRINAQLCDTMCREVPPLSPSGWLLGCSFDSDDMRETIGAQDSDCYGAIRHAKSTVSDGLKPMPKIAERISENNQPSGSP